MNKLTVTIALVLMMILGGCSSRTTYRILNDVESYIMERPDSALAVLDSMDRSRLTTDRLKAHHALLHAMALDKNYIDVTDDSLASVAVRYYQKHGSKKYLARSLYYKGLSYYYNKEYDKSIIELYNAEPVAAIHDSLYLGFIKVLQANIVKTNYNSFEEITALEKALEVYTSLKADYYINVAKLRLSQAYMAEEKYDDAEGLLSELISSDNLNSRLLAKSMGDYAFLMGTRPDADYKTAVTYFEKTAEVEKGKYMSRQDYWVWAHALAETGDFDRSRQIVEMLSPIDTSGTAYYWQYEIAKIRGDKDKAFELFEEFSRKNNEEVVQILRQSISTVQRDYYQSQYEISDYKARNRSLIMTVLIVSSLLLITLILFSALRYRRIKEEEKEQFIRYAEEINHQLSRYKDEDYPLLKKRFISLYKSRFETIGALCEQYLQNRNRDDAEKVMYQKVMLMVDDVRNDKVRKVKFEAVLDAELDNIMTRFREEMPKCKESDITLFSYLIAGFDATTISRLMNISLNNIYAQKRRLRIKIEEKTPKHMQQFLEMIH